MSGWNRSRNNTDKDACFGGRGKGLSFLPPPSIRPSHSKEIAVRYRTKLSGQQIQKSFI